MALEGVIQWCKKFQHTVVEQYIESFIADDDHFEIGANWPWLLGLGFLNILLLMVIGCCMTLWDLPSVGIFGTPVWIWSFTFMVLKMDSMMTQKKDRRDYKRELRSLSSGEFTQKFGANKKTLQVFNPWIHRHNDQGVITMGEPLVLTESHLKELSNHLSKEQWVRFKQYVRSQGNCEMTQVLEWIKSEQRGEHYQARMEVFESLVSQHDATTDPFIADTDPVGLDQNARCSTPDLNQNDANTGCVLDKNLDQSWQSKEWELQRLAQVSLPALPMTIAK